MKHWPLALVAIAVAVVYAPTLAGDLLNWDDNRFVADNPLFHGDVLTYIRAAVSSVQFDAYQPLHLLSYLPDRLLWPDSAWGFHALNLAVFAGDVCLVYRLALRVSGPAAAAIACALFALHPLVVEPVAWVTARKDLVSLLFILLALLREDRAALEQRSRWPSLALYVAALLTKSAAMFFPAVLALWLVFVREVPVRHVLRRVWPFAVPTVVAGVVVTVIWRSHGMIGELHASIPIDVASTLGLYASRIVVPLDLAPLYPDHVSSFFAVGVGIAAIALVGVRRRVPALAWFGVGTFVAVLLPVSNVVPIARFADRYALALLALLAPVLARGLEAVPWRRAIVAAAVVVAGAEAWAASRQVRAWDDSVALWDRAVQAQPDVLLAHLKRGETLRDAGRYPEAVQEYEAAIRIAPQSMLGYLGLFYAHAHRAEREGRLRAGTAAAWLARLDEALRDPSRYGDMFGEVAAANCLDCKDALLVLGLLTWPQPDAALLADAADALDRRVPDEAVIFLSQVKERDARYQDLLSRAAARR